MFDAFVDAHKAAQENLREEANSTSTTAALANANSNANDTAMIINNNEEAREELDQSRKNASADWIGATVLRSSGIHLCLPPFHPIASYMLKQVFLMRKYKNNWDSVYC